MSENPYADSMADYMGQLREIAKRAGSEGFNVVVTMSYEDPLKTEDDTWESGMDYGLFGSTYGTLGLICHLKLIAERGILGTSD